MEEVEATRPQSAPSDNATKISVMPDDMQPIFVCLFKRFADSIDKWQTELSRFDGNVLGRPFMRMLSKRSSLLTIRKINAPKVILRYGLRKTRYCSCARKGAT